METARLLADCLGIPAARAQANAPAFERALSFAEINSDLRLAHFIGQIGHETGLLRYKREVWGPTSAQVRYERRFDAPWPSSPEQARQPAYAANRLAYALGNDRAGDGKRYMGRGVIQTTGRTNYRRVTQRLQDALGDEVPDFEAAPLMLETAPWDWLSGADYWRMRGLNKFADADDILTLTRRVNGGLNGIAHRQALYTAARAVLARG